MSIFTSWFARMAFTCLLMSSLLVPALGQSARELRSALVIEAAGHSIGYSLNYEHRLWRGPSAQLSLRLGAGLLPTRLMVPVAAELALGRSYHHGVVGLGAVLDRQAEQRLAFGRQNSDTYLRLNAILGYRWQTLRERFFLQIHLVPGLELDPTPNQISSEPIEPRLTAGLLMGYRFR